VSTGKSQITIHEFAEQINVSTATIWRAIYNRKGISQETRERVLRQMAELGYQPNQAARALVTRQSHMIALWMQSLGDTYSTLVLREMRRVVAEHGYEMIVRDMGEGLSTRGKAQVTSQWPVDAIVVLDGTEEVRCLLRGSRRPLAPIVSIGGDIEECVDAVGIDLRDGARQATQHLISIGCKRVAFLGPRSISAPGQPRREGYLTAIIDRGLTPEFIVVDSDYATRKTAWECMKVYAKERGAPDGVFCVNDDQAIGTYRAVRELGLRVPEDVALVGCDGIEETDYYDTPISTLVQPVGEMCAKAWEFLMRRMNDPEIPRQHMLLKPELVVRKSSRTK
jgi:DNA-binding LacI/PurR family transcriptional regulator